LNEREYRERQRQVDKIRQDENHVFLKSLNEELDNYPVYYHVPKSFRLIERVSNLRGNMLSTQELGDPFAYLEFGDLVQRMAHCEKSLLTEQEKELIVPCAPKNSKNNSQMDSVEIARICLGYSLNLDFYTDEELQRAHEDRLSRTLIETETVREITEESRRAGYEVPRSPEPEKVDYRVLMLRDILGKDKVASDSIYYTPKKVNDELVVADQDRSQKQQPPNIYFKHNKFIKYSDTKINLDKSLANKRKKDFTEQVEIDADAELQNLKELEAEALRDKIHTAQSLKDQIPDEEASQFREVDKYASDKSYKPSSVDLDL